MQMIRSKLKVAVATSGLLALIAAVGPASAHPHIWVSTSSEVLFENGAIVGIRHSWTFDEYYSATATEGLDTNKDGIYSREELAELAKVNVEALKEFAYFTYPRLADKDIPVAPPKDYWLEHTVKPAGKDSAPAPNSPAAAAAAIVAQSDKSGGVLTLRFTLPLAQPVLAEAADFIFSIGDPSFFIAFDPASDAPVTIGAGAPKGCRIASDAKPDAANPGKPGDLMAPQPADGVNLNFVQAAAWKVICQPPS
ncbi:MAG: DUF1007 family protein [Hyphomicrobiaceae bacterium]|nr:DUF1007 family protein [Hyphomicrobiaceae bacterium]